MTHKKMISIVASEIGRHHRPQIYQFEIEKRFGVFVSASSIVKALGAYKSRKHSDNRLAEQKCHQFLKSCFGDKFQAKSLIDKLAGV